MCLSQADFLERTSDELDRIQREARGYGLLSIAYLIELAREELIDEMLRNRPRPAAPTEEADLSAPNVLPLNRRKTST